MAMKIKTKVLPNITKEQKETVLKMVRQCAKELGKKKYELPAWSGCLQLNIKNNSQRSYACARYISVDIDELTSKGDRLFSEYSRITESKVIGSFKGSAEKRMFALVAHEFAHHVHRKYKARWYRDKKPHGETWQYIYSILRRELVNPMD